MTWASKENYVTYIGQELYNQMENKNWQKLDRMADMRKALDAEGNMELFTNVSGMPRPNPGGISTV